jgi:hypothetical protein
MVHVPWFKDAAGSQYDVSFQQMPEQVRLVPNAVKETNADFSIYSIVQSGGRVCRHDLHESQIRCHVVANTQSTNAPIEPKFLSP